MTAKIAEKKLVYICLYGLLGMIEWFLYFIVSYMYYCYFKYHLTNYYDFIASHNRHNGMLKNEKYQRQKPCIDVVPSLMNGMGGKVGFQIPL